MTTSARCDEQQRIDREASAWVVLNDERELSREEERAFENWRHADPRHEQSYQATLQLWDDLPGASSVVAAPAAARSNVIPMAAPIASIPYPERKRRPLWAITFSAAAAIVLALILGPQWLRPGEQAYETALAQQRVVTLEDGSVVTLGPRTRLDVAFSNETRRVALAGGEAFFDISHDPARPFVVEAGTSLIQVMGTKFDVNVSALNVRVAVLEGTVEVRDTKAPNDRMVVLRQGQRTEVRLTNAATDITASITSRLPVTPTAQPAGAWRQGRFSYDNVRLADLVADLNRYHSPGVRLDDPSLGELRVTAFFSANEIPAFLDALPNIVAVETSASSNGAVRIGRPGS